MTPSASIHALMLVVVGTTKRGRVNDDERLGTLRVCLCASSGSDLDLPPPLSEMGAGLYVPVERHLVGPSEVRGLDMLLASMVFRADKLKAQGDEQAAPTTRKTIQHNARPPAGALPQMGPACDRRRMGRIDRRVGSIVC